MRGSCLCAKGATIKITQLGFNVRPAVIQEKRCLGVIRRQSLKICLIMTIVVTTLICLTLNILLEKCLIFNIIWGFIQLHNHSYKAKIV